MLGMVVLVKRIADNGPVGFQVCFLLLDECPRTFFIDGWLLAVRCTNYSQSSCFQSTLTFYVLHLQSFLVIYDSWAFKRFLIGYKQYRFHPSKQEYLKCIMKCWTKIINIGITVGRKIWESEQKYLEIIFQFYWIYF